MNTALRTRMQSLSQRKEEVEIETRQRSQISEADERAGCGREA